MTVKVDRIGRLGIPKEMRDAIGIKTDGYVYMIMDKTRRGNQLYIMPADESEKDLGTSLCQVRG